MSLEALLKYRELKANLINHLAKKDSRTLLVVRVNIPGPNKKTEWSQKLFNEAVTAVKSVCVENEIPYEDVTISLTRIIEPEEYVGIFYMSESAEYIKKKYVELEETHDFGRIFDIDVYDSNGNALTREQLSVAIRKCYLCDQSAYECARSRKHELKDLELFLISKASEL